uniref:Ovule protein n=1 Tax=Haemonchus contortus TaxID=6289 RepID=A0A7I4YRF9_HAECO
MVCFSCLLTGGSSDTTFLTTTPSFLQILNATKSRITVGMEYGIDCLYRSVVLVHSVNFFQMFSCFSFCLFLSFRAIVTFFTASVIAIRYQLIRYIPENPLFAFFNLGIPSTYVIYE